MVIKPKPPIWIRIIITVFPKIVNEVPVSSTTSPVTQVAEVEVNNASINSTEFPLVLEMGNISSKAPIRIIDAKPSTSICGGESFRNLNSEILRNCEATMLTFLSKIPTKKALENQC